MKTHNSTLRRVAACSARPDEEAPAAGLTEGLIESDHRKSEFLAMLAHELRNPLVPISNAVHLLKGLA